MEDECSLVGVQDDSIQRAAAIKLPLKARRADIPDLHTSGGVLADVV